MTRKEIAVEFVILFPLSLKLLASVFTTWEREHGSQSKR